MFGDARAFNGDIGSWDVSSVTDMRGMFWNARAFNGDLRSWDVSSVTDMRGMFEDARAFNGDISSWDVSSVTGMRRMFSAADSFNGDLSSWDVSSVTGMGGMFESADSFNGDISSWDVSSVTDMGRMFRNARAFNGDLSGWCVSNISSEPNNFSALSPLTEENKPLWGTCPGTPSQIILTSPANSATAVSLTPTFSWEEDADATSYQLQVFEGSDPLVIDITTGSTSFTVSESRKGDVTYNWRVRGINENKDRTGEWSEIWSFTTE
jgi:surface protein